MSKPIRIVGDLAVITLTRGKEAVIDAVDLPLIQPFSWRAYPSGNTWYARGRPGPFTVPETGLHTFLIRPPSGVLVDHEDGDGLNNRRKNLRLASKSQNTANRFREQSNATGYRGIRRLPSGRYQAYVTHQGRHIALGTFDTPEEAHQAYRLGAVKYHGEFATFT